MKIIVILLVVLLLVTSCDMVETDLPLVALNNKIGISGSFFLATGTIETKEFYFFMYRLPDGGLKRAKIRADSAIIYETHEPPHVKLSAIVRREFREEAFSSPWGDITDARFYIPPESIAKIIQINP